MTVSEKILDLRSKGEKALVCFFTAGDQPLSETAAIIGALEEGGADLIEVGIPFSDPFGEGPTIQASSQRSLDNGTTPEKILETLETAPKSIPVVTMGYYNPVLRMGLERYAQASARAGLSGTIISDLVPDEADAWDSASKNAGIETVYLIAPTSTEARIDEVCERTTGFVYAVSRTGVTGAENSVPPEVKGLVGRVRARTDKPVCVGFGISRPEHVRMVCEVADGAVVGSALVSKLNEVWHNGAGRAEIVAFVRELKEATKG
jgi:tryptophan synthase alpha chain